MATTKIAAIMRAGVFSPNHIGNDATILNTVAEQLPGVTELYRTGYHIYAYSSSGEVWRITADESYKGTVEKLA